MRNINDDRGHAAEDKFLQFDDVVNVWLPWQNPAVDGFNHSWLLIERPGRLLMYVGEQIYSFVLPKGETIQKYYSLIGNSVVPYPVLLGSKHVFFMLEGTEFLRRQVLRGRKQISSNEHYIIAVDHQVFPFAGKEVTLGVFNIKDKELVTDADWEDAYGALYGFVDEHMPQIPLYRADGSGIIVPADVNFALVKRKEKIVSEPETLPLKALQVKLLFARP